MYTKIEDYINLKVPFLNQKRLKIVQIQISRINRQHITSGMSHKKAKRTFGTFLKKRITKYKVIYTLYNHS